MNYFGIILGSATTLFFTLVLLWLDNHLNSDKYKHISDGKIYYKDRECMMKHPDKGCSYYPAVLYHNDKGEYFVRKAGDFDAKFVKQ